MTQLPHPPDTTPDGLTHPSRTDRSPWNWLLLVPIVLPVLTPLFNHDSPRLWGFPMFYWLQFAFSAGRAWPPSSSR